MHLIIVWKMPWMNFECISKVVSGYDEIYGHLVQVSVVEFHGKIQQRHATRPARRCKQFYNIVFSIVNSGTFTNPLYRVYGRSVATPYDSNSSFHCSTWKLKLLWIMLYTLCEIGFPDIRIAPFDPHRSPYVSSLLFSLSASILIISKYLNTLSASI